jgi:hypothetical protein
MKQVYHCTCGRPMEPSRMIGTLLGFLNEKNKTERESEDVSEVVSRVKKKKEKKKKKRLNSTD